MIEIKVLFFGITTDLVGKNSLTIELNKRSTVKDFKLVLTSKFPSLNNLNEFAIAVNEEYAEDNLLLNSNDIVAIIPPVSGG